jgi:hypothetical protein
MNQPNGIYKNLPPEQYLAADHINNSALKLINTPFFALQGIASPANRRNHSHGDELCRSYHRARTFYTLLEHYCVAPKCDKRTKESKLGLIRKPRGK